MQATSISLPCYANARNKADLYHYFESSDPGVEPVEDGLPEVYFGEYLVEQGLIDRFQLFCTLQLQDQMPGLRFGEAAAALGFAPAGDIGRMLEQFQELGALDVG